jgi:hypothetical protein
LIKTQAMLFVIGQNVQTPYGDTTMTKLTMRDISIVKRGSNRWQAIDSDGHDVTYAYDTKQKALEAARIYIAAKHDQIPMTTQFPPWVPADIPEEHKHALVNATSAQVNKAKSYKPYPKTSAELARRLYETFVADAMAKPPAKRTPAEQAAIVAELEKLNK